MNPYTYRIEWSPLYVEYIASCVELPFLRRQAPTAQEAVSEIETAANEHVECMRNLGETPPTPLSERRYSGTFVVRTSPELHGRLVRDAAEQGVSMNQWVVQKLSGRQLSDTFGLSGFD